LSLKKTKRVSIQRRFCRVKIHFGLFKKPQVADKTNTYVLILFSYRGTAGADMNQTAGADMNQTAGAFIHPSSPQKFLDSKQYLTLITFLGKVV
jgi:hypothetical protein